MVKALDSKPSRWGFDSFGARKYDNKRARAMFIIKKLKWVGNIEKDLKLRSLFSER